MNNGTLLQKYKILQFNNILSCIIKKKGKKYSYIILKQFLQVQKNLIKNETCNCIKNRK